MEPILKWAGGKRQLLPEIKKVIVTLNFNGHCFYEPFVGGGAVFMDMCFPKAAINDINPELINVYIQIKENPYELIKLLEKHKENHCHDYFYEIRNLDRNPDFEKMSDIEKAARTIYLNRVCYNGLYRVNSKGQFNVPLGRYSNPEIVLKDKILELSDYLKSNNIKITCQDFEKSIKSAKQGDLIYFDPPYDYEESGFTSYTKDGFSKDSLIRLKKVCDKLLEKGCKIILSNNDTKFVNELFSEEKYKIKHVLAKRMINCNGEKRDSVMEVIIYG